ncbi:AAA family ATPase [Phaeodactylibacter xiamenensis]|uniref:AAA family ATPase n=1 Tax=Phaeodactylibacter xiamenensis TaxID=1524460 RepID=UPI0024A9D396|nr:AAA family ATPase [Phaeodactylibacter xiamenensis]
MISQIKRIKNLGVYQDFRWDGTTDGFKKLNLIYGWNYAGKTTLSRVFRCLELKRLHNVDSNTQFELINDDSSVDNERFERTNNIKVFNSDYIVDNLRWEEEAVNPILIVGEESVQLREKQQKIKDEISLTEQKVITEREKLRSKEKHISARKTDIAREIGTLLHLRTFNKTHFDKILSTYNPSAAIHLLSQIELQDSSRLANNREKQSPVNALQLSEIDIEQLNQQVKILLETRIDTVTIQALVDDDKLNTWVKQGFEIHQERETCGFCGAAFEQGLMERLAAHYSEAYKELDEKLHLQIRSIQTKKNALQQLQLPDSSRLFPAFRSDYDSIVTNFTSSLDTACKYLEELVEMLEQKQEQPFKIIRFTAKSRIQVPSLNDINGIIQKHNKRVATFEEEKRVAQEVVKAHYISRFIKEEHYFESLEEQKQLSQSILNLQQDIRELKKQDEKIEQQISSTAKGAEQINEFLISYFGKEDIQLKVKDGNQYQLIRRGKRAKNLSEGEKTAIAFAYFMASLKEKSNELKDTIVYIDDPISSLDSNHLFNTFSFIKGTFMSPTGHSNPKYEINCKQLFVSTHNIEFFNLIKEWMNKFRKGKHTTLLLIEKGKDGQSKIKALPEILARYKSEYNYLFSLIYYFQKQPHLDYDQLYNLPNIIRRFLESFLAFKYQANVNIDQDINRLIPNQVKSEQVRKFVHFYSHSLAPSRMMVLSDLSECQAVVDTVLDAVKAHDPVHFEALEESIHPPK